MLITLRALIFQPDDQCIHQLHSTSYWQHPHKHLLSFQQPKCILIIFYWFPSNCRHQALTLSLQIHIGSISHSHLIFTLITITQSLSPINFLVSVKSLKFDRIPKQIFKRKEGEEEESRRPWPVGSMVRLVVDFVDGAADRWWVVHCDGNSRNGISDDLMLDVACFHGMMLQRFPVGERRNFPARAKARRRTLTMARAGLSACYSSWMVRRGVIH